MEINIEHASREITEQSLIDKGKTFLTAMELRERILGRKIIGLYRYPFKYVGYISPDGTMNGTNNYGTSDVGVWKISDADHTLEFKWQGGWDNWTCRAYLVDNEILLFNTDSGTWRTSFNTVI